MEHSGYPSVSSDFLDFKATSPQMARSPLTNSGQQRLNTGYMNSINTNMSNMNMHSYDPQPPIHNQQMNLVPHQPQVPMQSNVIQEEILAQLQSLKSVFNKMMGSIERLEVRVSKVESVTSQILKNQQEVLQVPFMSQSDLDQARQVAEQLERDSTVAKQLQAAYNKETDLKKSSGYRPTTASTECPICGLRVSNYDLEVHVDKCLAMFSNDPKKEAQVKDTQKKVEAGFFAKMFKGAKTEKTETTTTTTKTTTTGHNDENQGFNYYNNGYPPQIMSPHMMQGHPGMVMPMYMYPSYPNVNQQHPHTQLE